MSDVVKTDHLSTEGIRNPLGSITKDAVSEMGNKMNPNTIPYLSHNGSEWGITHGDAPKPQAKMVKDMTKEERKEHYAQRAAQRKVWEERADASRKREQDRQKQERKLSCQAIGSLIDAIRQEVGALETPEFVAALWPVLCDDARRIATLFNLSTAHGNELESSIIIATHMTRAQFSSHVKALYALNVLVPDFKRDDLNLWSANEGAYDVEDVVGMYVYTVAENMDRLHKWRFHRGDWDPGNLKREVRKALAAVWGYQANAAVKHFVLGKSKPEEASNADKG